MAHVVHDSMSSRILTRQDYADTLISQQYTESYADKSPNNNYHAIPILGSKGLTNLFFLF